MIPFLVLLVLHVTVPALASSTPSEVDTEVQATHRPGDPKAPYPGIYIFWDSSNVDPASYPAVTGGNMTFNWSDIERADDYFDWFEVDEWLAEQSSLGKPAGLGFSLYDGRCCGGSRLPTWLQWQNEETVVRCDAQLWPIPRYWHPDVLSEYEEFVRRYADRYDGDSRVAWFELGTGIFGESKPADVSDWECLLDAGLTEELWIATSKQILDIFADAFTDTQLFYQFAPTYSPVDQSIRQRKELTDYAANLGIGLKHNGLQPDADNVYVDDESKSYYKSGHWDPFFTWWEGVPVAWESYGTQYCGDKFDESLNPHLTMWCVYSGLNKHADYFVFSKDLAIDPVRQTYLDFANHYLGVELDETDSVWVAMRETELSWFPQRGNYDMWLYQNDLVVGGRSVAEWNVTDAPEGRYTRRTDRATSNSDLYFDVADGWLYQESDQTVTIEVIYLDQGSGSWLLYYDAVAEPGKLAGIVEKRDSGQWLTRTFEVSDAYFGNRLAGGGDHPGSDFYVRASQDDTYFHRFRVFRHDVAPTPTPQPIVTVTPSHTPAPEQPQPTPTPLSVSLRDGVYGYDGTEDTWIGAWCDRDGPDEGTVPHGHQEYLGMRSSDEIDVCNALIRFEINGIPQNAFILSAQLILKPISDGNGSRTYFNTYDLYKEWSEDEATWYVARNGVSWDASGADGAGDHPYLPLDVSMLSGPISSSVWTSANITPLVRRWVLDPDSNYGVLLRSHGRRVGYELASSEHPEIKWRPVLEIQYYPEGGIPATATSTVTPTVTPTATSTTTATSTPTITPALTATPSPSPTPSTGGIDGWVFYDVDGDYSYSDEPGISGAVLTMTNQSDGTTLTELTDDQGYYHFSELPTGVYTLDEIRPEGWSEPQPYGNNLALLVSANHTHRVQFAHQPLPTATVTPSVTPQGTLWLPLYQR